MVVYCTGRKNACATRTLDVLWRRREGRRIFTQLTRSCKANRFHFYSDKLNISLPTDSNRFPRICSYSASVLPEEKNITHSESRVELAARLSHEADVSQLTTCTDDCQIRRLYFVAE